MSNTGAPHVLHSWCCFPNQKGNTALHLHDVYGLSSVKWRSEEQWGQQSSCGCCKIWNKGVKHYRMTVKEGEVVRNGAHTRSLWVRTMWEAWSWKNEQGTVVNVELAMTMLYSLHCLRKSSASWREEKVGTVPIPAAAFRTWQQTSENPGGWKEQPSAVGLWGPADREPMKPWRLRAWLSNKVQLHLVYLKSRGGGASGWVTDFRFTTDSSQLMNFLHLLWKTL